MNKIIKISSLLLFFLNLTIAQPNTCYANSPALERANRGKGSIGYVGLPIEDKRKILNAWIDYESGISPYGKIMTFPTKFVLLMALGVNLADVGPLAIGEVFGFTVGKENWPFNSDGQGRFLYKEPVVFAFDIQTLEYAKQIILSQYPEFKSISIPNFKGKSDVETWLQTMYANYGYELPVVQLNLFDKYGFINPSDLIRLGIPLPEITKLNIQPASLTPENDQHLKNLTALVRNTNKRQIQILITGPSASGKTTIIENLVTEHQDQIPFFVMSPYYKRFNFKGYQREFNVRNEIDLMRSFDFTMSMFSS